MVSFPAQAMTVLRASDFEQPVLQKSGDDLRIDWGYLLLAVPDQPGASVSTQSSDDVVSQFTEGKTLSVDDIDMPRRADRRTVLASVFDLGQVAATVRRPVTFSWLTTIFIPSNT